MSKFSIPDFSVRVDEGHPLHAPFNDTVTLPLLNDSKSIAPPSCSTAGFIYSSKIFLIFSSILFDFDSDFTDDCFFVLDIISFSSSIYFFIKSLKSYLISSQENFSLFVIVIKLLIIKTLLT